MNFLVNEFSCLLLKLGFFSTPPVYEKTVYEFTSLYALISLGFVDFPPLKIMLVLASCSTIASLPIPVLFLLGYLPRAIIPPL